MLPEAKLDLDNIYQITVLLQACSRRLVVKRRWKWREQQGKKRRSESPQRHGYINF